MFLIVKFITGLKKSETAFGLFFIEINFGLPLKVTSATK